jgi:hypothetical protein
LPALEADDCLQGTSDILSAAEHVSVAPGFERANRHRLLGRLLFGLGRRGGGHATDQAAGWKHVS